MYSAKCTWLALSLSSLHASDPPLAAACKSARWGARESRSSLSSAWGALLLAASVVYLGSCDANERSDDWEGYISLQTVMTGSQLLLWA